METTYVWEWKGGGEWNEYPDSISARIDEAYFNGTLRFDVELSRGEYVIDLTKLQQISKDTGKTRKIQRVKWEYDPSRDGPTGDDLKMDIDGSPKKKTDSIPSAKSDDSPNKNVQSPPDDKLSCLSSDPDTDIDSNMKDLSVDNKPLKRQRKKKTPKRTKPTKPTVKQLLSNKRKVKKADTLLGAFNAGKNEAVPAALMSLKKKKKRKLSDILSDEDGQNEDSHSGPPIKKRKSSDVSPSKRISISKKYSEKQGTDQLGAELNKLLIDALWEMSMIERNSGNRIKANAYSKACASLRSCGKKISSGKEAQKLPGIGKKIALKIDELLETGGLVKLDKLRADDTVQAVNELCQIHGIGPKKAADLVKEHKIYNLDALRKRPELLNHQQKIGLKYFEHINSRIPREQCTKIGDIVGEEMKKIDTDIRYSGYIDSNLHISHSVFVY